MLQLGLDGFSFTDLQQPAGLARLHARTLGLYPEEASPLAARPQQG